MYVKFLVEYYTLEIPVHDKNEEKKQSMHCTVHDTGLIMKIT